MALPVATVVAPDVAVRRPGRLISARWLWVIGPGLIVMLADTDAGSVGATAQSGARWGYRLLVLELILIPVLCGSIITSDLVDEAVTRLERAPAGAR